MTPPNTIASDTLVEAIARALHNADAQHFAISYDGPIPEYYTNRAQAALTAITEAGYAVVPVTATEEMLEVGAHCASTVPIPHTAERIYRSMIAASPVTHCNHTNNGKAE